MFGLGLYIYSGEDLPEGEDDDKPAPDKKFEPRTQADIKQVKEIEEKMKLYEKIKELKIDVPKMLEYYKCEKIGDMSIVNLVAAIKAKEAKASA